MITPSEYIQDGKYMGAATLYGLSSESKPTTYGNGSKFIEVDTGKTYYFDATGSEWHTEGEEETQEETKQEETKAVTKSTTAKTTAKKSTTK